MAVLRHSNFGHRGRNPLLVPSAAVELDRQHPLANGMTAYLLPQVSGADAIRNLAHLTSDVASGGGSPVFWMGPRGIEAQTLSTASYWAGPTLTSVVGATTASVWFYGRQAGNWDGTKNSPYLGVTYDNLDNDPYFAISIHVMAPTGEIKVLYNNGGYNELNTGIKPPSGIALNYLAAVQLGGNVRFYQDGQLYTSGSAPAGTIAILASALTQVGSIRFGYTGGGMVAGAIWNRELTAGEAAWISAEPFAMLRPIVRRRFYLPSVVAAPAGKRPRITMAV